MRSLRSLRTETRRLQRKRSQVWEWHIIFVHASISARDFAMHNRTKSRDDALRVQPKIDRRVKEIENQLESLNHRIESNVSNIQWIMDGCPPIERMSYYEAIMEGHIGRE